MKLFEILSEIRRLSMFPGYVAQNLTICEPRLFAIRYIIERRTIVCHLNGVIKISCCELHTRTLRGSGLLAEQLGN